MSFRYFIPIPLSPLLIKNHHDQNLSDEEDFKSINADDDYLQWEFADILRKDKQFILHFLKRIKHDKVYLIENDSKWMKDFDLIMGMIREYPNCIEYVPFKKFEYCWEAINRNVQLFKYAHPLMKRSDQVVWEIFERDPSALRWASKFVKRGPLALKIIDSGNSTILGTNPIRNLLVGSNEKYWHDWSFVLEAVKRGYQFDKITDTYQKSGIMALEALKRGFDFRRIQADALNDEKVIREIERQIGKNWNDWNEWKSDADFILQLLTTNVEILGHVNQELLKDYNFMESALKVNPKSIDYFDTTLQDQLLLDNKSLLIKCLRLSFSNRFTERILQDNDVKCSLIMELNRGYHTRISVVNSTLIYADFTTEVRVENFTDYPSLFLAINSPTIWEHANRSIATNTEILKSENAGRNIGFIIRFLSREHLLLLIQSNPRYSKDIFQAMHQYIRVNIGCSISFLATDEELTLEFIKADFACMDDADSNFKQDSQFIEKAIAIHLGVLHYLDWKYVNFNKELVINAFKTGDFGSKIKMTQYFAHLFESEEEMLLTIFKYARSAKVALEELFWKSNRFEEMKTNAELGAKLMEFHLDMHKFLDPSIVKANKHLFINLLNDSSIQFSPEKIPNMLTNDPDIIRAYFTRLMVEFKKPSNFGMLRSELLGIRSLFLEALKTCPKLYTRLPASHALLMDYDVIETALKSVKSERERRLIVETMPDEIKETKKHLFELLKRKIWIGSDLFNISNMDFVLEHCSLFIR